jgi:hypothetical protein
MKRSIILRWQNITALKVGAGKKIIDRSAENIVIR